MNRIKRISSYSVDPYFADGVVAELLGTEEVERIIISAGNWKIDGACDATLLYPPLFW